MWGKFGQAMNRRQSTFITDEADFFKAFTDPTRNLSDWHILNDNIVQLEWENQEQFIPESDVTNMFIATFTTAHARLCLYDLLEKLDDRVCYYDTDAVIWVHRDGLYDPPLGDFLGQLTDELDGSYITEFVSAGPKNYSYKLANGECKCKVKGFTLNYTNSSKINFESMKEEVFKYCQNQPQGNIFTTSNKICRDKYKHLIFNRKENKQYNVVYTKRCIKPTLDTVPFGF